jgi:hypothetical protein
MEPVEGQIQHVSRERMISMELQCVKKPECEIKAFNINLVSRWASTRVGKDAVFSSPATKE